MLRRFAPALLTAIFGTAIACNALTGVGDLAVGESDVTGAPDASSSASSTTSSGGVANASSTSTTSSSSGGFDPDAGDEDTGTPSSSGTPPVQDSGPDSSGTVPVDSGSPPVDSGIAPSDSGTTNPPLLDETFDTSCDGWTATNGGSTQWLGESRSGTGGSCALCATVAGDTQITKTFTTPKGGHIVATGYFVGDGQAGSAKGAQTAEVNLATKGPGGGGTGAGSAAVNAVSFTSISTTKVLVTAGDAVQISVGLPTPAVGSCVLIDDITITIQ